MFAFYLKKKKNLNASKFFLPELVKAYKDFVVRQNSKDNSLPAPLVNDLLQECSNLNSLHIAYQILKFIPAGKFVNYIEQYKNKLIEIIQSKCVKSIKIQQITFKILIKVYLAQIKIDSEQELSEKDLSIVLNSLKYDSTETRENLAKSYLHF